MSKELYIAAHQDLIEEYLEAHPDATYDEACDKTADAAWMRMTDMIADAADRLKDERKYRNV